MKRLYSVCVASILLTGCKAAPPKAEVSAQIVANCPELSGSAPKDMGALSLMLIDTSTQYNKCRAAALGKVPK